ncbi:hypothetical protein BC937DRAFT_86804, partial [Endogone sp. FLAS-F59071]
MKSVERSINTNINISIDLGAQDAHALPECRGQSSTGQSLHDDAGFRAQSEKMRPVW